MKKIVLLFVCTITALLSFGQVVIKADGAMHPNGDYPVAFSSEVKGAPKWVADLAARDTIKNNLREVGMTCFVNSNNTFYYLQGGITNANWQTLVLEQLTPEKFGAAGDGITNDSSAFIKLFAAAASLNNAGVRPAIYLQPGKNYYIKYNKGYSDDTAYWSNPSLKAFYNMTGSIWKRPAPFTDFDGFECYGNGSTITIDGDNNSYFLTSTRYVNVNMQDVNIVQKDTGKVNHVFGWQRLLYSNWKNVNIRDVYRGRALVLITSNERNTFTKCDFVNDMNAVTMGFPTRGDRALVQANENRFIGCNIIGCGLSLTEAQTYSKGFFEIYWSEHSLFEGGSWKANKNALLIHSAHSLAFNNIYFEYNGVDNSQTGYKNHIILDAKSSILDNDFPFNIYELTFNNCYIGSFSHVLLRGGLSTNGNQHHVEDITFNKCRFGLQTGFNYVTGEESNIHRISTNNIIFSAATGITAQSATDPYPTIANVSLPQYPIDTLTGAAATPVFNVLDVSFSNSNYMGGAKPFQVDRNLTFTKPVLSDMKVQQGIGMTMYMGADASGTGTTLTANTNKSFKIGMPSYGRSDYTNPVLMLGGTVSGSFNALSLGGGSGAGYAATDINFYTGPNTTTPVGTFRGRFNNTGQFLLNASSDPTGLNHLLYVNGTSYFVDSVKTNGYVLMQLNAGLRLRDTSQNTNNFRLTSDPAGLASWQPDFWGRSGKLTYLNNAGDTIYSPGVIGTNTGYFQFLKLKPSGFYSGTYKRVLLRDPLDSTAKEADIYAVLDTSAATGKVATPYSLLKFWKDSTGNIRPRQDSATLTFFDGTKQQVLPRQDRGSAPPTTGSWPTGFIRWNTNPASGIDHWTCIAAGTPGSWQSWSGGSSSGTATDTTSLSNRIDTKIDSLKRIGTNVYYYKGGLPTLAYTDSVGTAGGGGTCPVIGSTAIPYANSEQTLTDDLPYFNYDVTSHTVNVQNVTAAKKVAVQHLIALGGTPSFSVNPAFASSVSCVISGADGAMTITLTITGSVSGTLGYIYYSTPYEAVPVVTCSNPKYGQPDLYANGTGLDAITLAGGFAAGTYYFNLHSIQPAQ